MPGAKLRTPESEHVGLTHVDATGAARMVDVSAKDISERRAVAGAVVRMRSSTLDAIYAGSFPKGDVLAVARVAGIQAAKETSRLIPLCHVLPLTGASVTFERAAPGELVVLAEVKTVARTGVEMEALAAVTVAALTVYDMCKAIDRAMQIDAVRLLEKDGGRTGSWRATPS